jgi:hypothetical protein
MYSHSWPCCWQQQLLLCFENAQHTLKTLSKVSLLLLLHHLLQQAWQIIERLLLPLPLRPRPPCCCCMGRSGSCSSLAATAASAAVSLLLLLLLLSPLPTITANRLISCCARLECMLLLSPCAPAAAAGSDGPVGMLL